MRANSKKDDDGKEEKGELELVKKGKKMWRMRGGGEGGEGGHESEDGKKIK